MAPSSGSSRERARPPYLDILEHVEEGILLLDGNVVQWLNPAARLMFPSMTNPSGRALLEVVRDHRIEELASKTLTSHLEEAAEVELPISARRLLVRALPLGEPAMALVIQDVTRLRYMETVRQQFVANLSHEMRTPLAGLDLAVQTLSTQVAADDDARVFVDRIAQEAQRLAAILQNLTQLAALDAGHIPVDRVAFLVDELVESLVDRYQQRAAAAGLTLRAEKVSGGLLALGDRGKTDQALQNIVDNALKFTPTGEVAIRVSGEPSRVEIGVRDTGPGIPSADLSRIFERFYKVDRSRGGQPGSGLGLSIARHLIELQGGTILAESTPGQGTLVRVRLPRASLTSP